ncbi:uncharacterized mitochondrial protein AtMg00820-like, partial [Teleopsis dalmanni]|uniref:uncharacterized mitochondrial protein AtMg00820-like n=1 Tax=Teleopsis dalmanni TaxID=139649 RepID=UPI0018CF9A41
KSDSLGIVVPIIQIESDNSGKNIEECELPLKNTENETKSSDEHYKVIDNTSPECSEIQVISNEVEEESDIRRSKRIASKNSPYNFCALDYISNDPCSFEEAMSSNNSDKWKAAMQSEIDSLLRNKTWKLTELPADKKAIPSKWVFKTKLDAQGTPVCRKARLVAKGFGQIEGIEYTETFAPVVRYESIRFLLALAAKNDLIIHQMDAVTAYLNGILDEEIYMKQPKGFNDSSGKLQ